MSEYRQIAKNKKAFRDYHIVDRFEAGIALQGSEVKSLRNGSANLKDSYATISNGEVFLHQLHIGIYDKATIYNHDPLRVRKLLLQKREIKKLSMATLEKGLTIIPLTMYWKGNLAKVELALARGKRMYDKRDAIAKRDQARELDRAMKDHLKYRKR